MSQREKNVIVDRINDDVLFEKSERMDVNLAEIRNAIRNQEGPGADNQGMRFVYDAYDGVSD